MNTLEKTPQQSAQVVMTSRALDLLDCFQNGFDSVVQQLAERFAKERQPAFEGQVVEVGVEDVRKAGYELIELVRSLVAQNKLPPEIIPQVDVMGDCLSCK